MKRTLFSCLVSVFALTATLPLYAQTDREVTIGERLTMTSEVLGEERSYWVYLPASYHDSTYALRDYPILYLLDGNAHFHSATGVVQFMGTGINGNIQIPEMIVVAIPNTNRTRDLTPTHTAAGFDGTENPGFAMSGGGDKFLQFIRDELFPEIESTYRTMPYRILVGHSFGGLLALHALLDAPDMFQSYIAIDPSLWWDDQVLVQRVEERVPDVLTSHGAVYISLANNPAIGDGDPSIMENAGRAFAQVLEERAPAGFRSSLQYFEREDHGSVPLVSLYNGLLHIFDGYKPSMAAFFRDPAALGPHFSRASERLGVTLLPPERTVNQLGYAMLRQPEGVDKALELFKLNVEHFPQSFNAYDSLAEAYMAKGETALAIENYRKSLELNPANSNAEQKLAELGEEDGGN